MHPIKASQRLVGICLDASRLQLAGRYDWRACTGWQPGHFPICVLWGRSPDNKKPRKTEALCVLENGAGEAIRTPDPNLGKVVLYP